MFTTGPSFFNSATSAPTDPYYSSVVSLLNFQGANGSTTFTDAKGKVWTPNGTAQISTAQAINGTSAGYFNGSSWIQTPDSTDFTTGSGDFTLELYMYSAGNAAYDQLCAQRDSGGTAKQALAITRNNTANTLLLAYTLDGVSITTQAGTANVFNSTWHHIAVVRNGTAYRMYVDGVLDASLTLTSGATFYDSADVFSIGRSGAYNGQYFNGYIGAFRLTKGVARYTSNFTRPTAPFPTS